MRDCIHVQHLSSNGKHSEAHGYLLDNIESIGIVAEDFKTYVQWLMDQAAYLAGYIQMTDVGQVLTLDYSSSPTFIPEAF